MLARLFFAIIVFAVPLNAFATSIDWEIANRYRLFRDESQFRTIFEIYSALPESDKRDRPAYALEVALEQKAAAKQLGPAFGDPVSVARYGWASAVVNKDKNCFSAGDRSYYVCKLANGDNYLEPKKFDALAKLTDAAQYEGKECVWTLNRTQVAQGPCTQTVRLPNVPYDEAFSISVSVDGAAIASIDKQIGRVVTIVGMGDSFASGEGNPDKPVKFGRVRDRFNHSSHIKEGDTSPAENDRAFRAYPLRDGVQYGLYGPMDFGHRSAAAKWLMEQCHRSLYSQQVKATLQLALEQPHLAVTFLGYACTGATVDEGMLGFWEARGDTAHYDASPQIMKFLRDVCRNKKGYNIYFEPPAFDWKKDIAPCDDRLVDKIDAVLLSIGGNDVKFASVIANESLKSGGRYDPFLRMLFKVWKEAADPVDFATALEIAKTKLPDFYRELSVAIHKHIRVPGNSVILTGYPFLTKLSDDTACSINTATEGMQVHEILGLRKPSTGPGAVAFVNELNTYIGKAVADLPAEDRWQVVTDHVEKFTGHAICPGANSPDVWQFPTWDGKQWLYFSPMEWVVYAPRNRWFVTPNDAFLTGNYMNQKVPPTDRVQPLYAATLSGSFHPNALGHAAVADSVVLSLRNVLILQKP